METHTDFRQHCPEEGDIDLPTLKEKDCSFGLLDIPGKGLERVAVVRFDLHTKGLAALEEAVDNIVVVVGSMRFVLQEECDDEVSKAIDAFHNIYRIDVQYLSILYIV